MHCSRNTRAQRECRVQIAVRVGLFERAPIRERVDVPLLSKLGGESFDLPTERRLLFGGNDAIGGGMLQSFGRRSKTVCKFGQICSVVGFPGFSCRSHFTRHMRQRRLRD